MPTGSIENERDGEKDAESEVSLGAEGTVSGVTSDSLESDCRTQWTKAEASEAGSTRPALTGSNKNERDAEKGAEVSRKARERESTTACFTNQTSSAQTSTRPLEAATATGQAQPEVRKMKRTSNTCLGQRSHTLERSQHVNVDTLTAGLYNQYIMTDKK